MGQFLRVNQQDGNRNTSQRTMRGFMILGALSALTQGAELPVTVNGVIKDVAYLYYTGQMPATDALPSAWAGTCSSGTKQSPIDVKTADLVVESTDPGEIMLTGHDIQLTGSVKTDSRQIYFVPTAPASGFRPILSGGALSSSKVYVFDHFEFKFGQTSATGSEHLIDSKQYPMEIQFVYFDQTTHADAATAGAHANADSVVVVSYLVETDTTDNTALTDVMTAITAAPKPAATYEAVEETGKTVTLKTLMGDIDSIKDYYYYAGSQSSSNCEENVKWIIATEKLKISTTQLALFPLLLDADGSTGFVYNNYRPVTGDSISVMHRKDETKKSETYEDAANILGASVVGITAFELFRNFLTQPETAKALKSNPILDLIEDFDQKFLNGEEEQQQQQQQQQFQPQQFQS